MSGSIHFMQMVHETVPGYSPKEVDLAAYNPFQVELLLNQAANLLDRVISTNSTYEEMRAKNAQQIIALNQLTREIKVQDTLLNQEVTVVAPQSKSFKVFKASYEAALALQTGLDNAYQSYTDAAYSTNNPDDIRGFYSAEAIRERASWERTSANALCKLAEAECGAFEQRVTAEKERLKALTDAMKENGPLDFSKQSKDLARLIERDRNDAFDRLRCASSGLMHIYGDAYIRWLEKNDIKGDEALPEEAGDPIQIINWTRNAIAFLSEFEQRDQGFTICVSLRDVLGDGKWGDWKTGGYREISFALDPSVFSEYRYVRLRGISAVVVSDRQEYYPWRVIIKPPRRQRAQTSGGLADKFVDLPLNSQVSLGRVETQNSYRMPDVSGMISLYNLCPCSHRALPWASVEAWSIRAERSQRSLDNGVVDDLRLELVVAGLPA